jgi:type I site-specific restriction-modification system R (restriction) subunit
MSLGSERSSVQNPFLRYAHEAGWTYLTPEQALDLRRGLIGPVLDSVLVDQLQRLNRGVVDLLRAEAIRDRLVRVRPGIEGNLDAWEFLKGLKTVFVEAERRERNVRLIDFDNLEANLYRVTDELTFSNGTPPDIRTDVNFFINGIPIILGETKSAKKAEGIAEALDDIRAYHRDGPELLTVAKRLIEDPVFENPTVLMLVDRNELEAQLFRNLDELGIDYVVVDSKRELQRVLRADRRGLIVSTIHKFDESDADLILRANVFVLVDEAHRTTGGDLGNYLDAALPNATWIGFTGTPIDKTAYGRGTFKTFGVDDQPQGYLDKYSIRESVADGTTVPLHYQLAPNELRVDRETLEKEFFALAETEGVSDIEELNKVLERAVTLRNMMKNPQRVEGVAEFVAKHFRETIEPMGYKAFLVAVDREACALDKDALDKRLPAE